MRIMGLDVGSKTVGVAISDPLGFTAQGLEIIQIDEEKGEFGFDRLSELVKEYRVDRFVVGLPKNMNNTSGPRVEASQAYGKRLEELFNLPVEYQDERLTTVAAERMLIEQADISRNKRKKGCPVDFAKLFRSKILEKRGNKMAHNHDHDHNHDERELITLVDEQGNETLFEILLTIDGKEEFGKNYVLLIPANAEEDENGEVEIQAYSFTENEDGTEGDLQPIPEDSDDEWNMIEEVFNSFMEE